MEKYGFVYIWRDRKHNRYYVGSHWGHVGDGYVCSSRWMNSSYKRRPGDFKRRILKVTHNRSELYEEEHRWISMIKPHEMKKRYYNLCRLVLGPWYTSEEKRSSTIDRIKESHWSRDPVKKASVVAKMTGRTHTAETREKIGRIGRGRKLSESARAKMSASKKGVSTGPVSEETRAKLRAANLGKKRPTPPGYVSHWKGVKRGPMSEETRAKLREINTGRTHGPEAREKCRAAALEARSREREAGIVRKSRGPVSAETRAKMSESQVKRHAARRDNVETRVFD